MLFREGCRPSSRCVDEALAALREDGTLDSIQDRWLSQVVDVPVLTP